MLIKNSHLQMLPNIGKLQYIALHLTMPVFFFFVFFFWFSWCNVIQQINKLAVLRALPTESKQLHVA